MLRVSFLLAALIGTLGASAVTVPTTYCDSAKDQVNVAATLEADVWPPALGSRVTLTLTGDIDDVILNTSFKVHNEFLPVKEGVTIMHFDVPADSHTGIYALDIHGKKKDNEVYCVNAEWKMESSTEDRGTTELWDDVARKLADLDLQREKLKKEMELNPPKEERPDIPNYTPEVDPVEAHERMMRTYDEVHRLYPHMMRRQQPATEVEDAPAGTSE
jgi:hypothetical protein